MGNQRQGFTTGTCTEPDFRRLGAGRQIDRQRDRCHATPQTEVTPFDPMPAFCKQLDMLRNTSAIPTVCFQSVFRQKCSGLVMLGTYLRHPILPNVISDFPSAPPCTGTASPAPLYYHHRIQELNLLGQTVKPLNQPLMPHVDQRTLKTGVYLTDLPACNTYTGSGLLRHAAKRGGG